MNNFEEYFLMDVASVIDYARKKLNIFGDGEELTASEIGDGNLNYVFRVKSEATGKSVIIKQAGLELRIAKDFDISVDRNRIEVGMLKLEKKICPNLVADIYHYDSVMKCFAMEDLSDYTVMRNALMKHDIFPKFAGDITDFLVYTLFMTTDRVMDSKEKKALVQEYINPQLCADITEALVFTEPYNDEKKRNRVFAPNLDFVQKELYCDKELHLEVAKLKYDFMNNAQALIHGDLHTGSIFIKHDSTKVMDPEFAFYGPMGYDIGNIVANMIFAWMNGNATMDESVEKDRYLAWVEEVICQVVDLFKTKYDSLFDRYVIEPMAKTPGYKKYFLQTILADTAGATGLEINRRVVGLAQVKDLTAIPNEKKRKHAERICILAAKEFIKKRNTYTEGQHYVDVIKNLVGE